MDSKSKPFQMPLVLNVCKDILWDSSGILIFDDTGTVVLANHKAESIIGYSSGGLVGLKASELSPDASIQINQDLLKECTTSDPANMFTRIAKCLKRDGSEINVRASLVPFQVLGTSMVYVMSKIDLLNN